MKALKNASRSSAFLVKRFSLKNLKRSSSNTFNGVESEKKVEEQKLVSKVLSGQSTLSNSNLSNNLKVDKGKRADLSNSTSSYSNISSSNSSQANYSHTNEQTLVNHTNLAIKETKQYLKQNILGRYSKFIHIILIIFIALLPYHQSSLPPIISLLMIFNSLRTARYFGFIYIF